MPQLLDGLPALYRDLLPAFFQREVPEETKATCGTCAMCEQNATHRVESVDGTSRFFRPDTKCCTFHPRLPNYLIGGILSDARPELAEGRRRIEAKLAARTGVSPQWVNPPAKFNLFYGNSRRTFGRSTTLLCPYFDKGSGGCTVWPYREAVCSTFFCKHVSGADGRKMWMQLKSYLSLVEVQLSRYALLELAPDLLLVLKDRAESPNPVLSAEELDDGPPPEHEYRALWGSWVGREAELFRKSYELVRALKPADIERFLGLDGTIEIEALGRSRQQVVDPKLPDTLKLNPAATVKWLPDGSIGLGAYSEYDAVALPGAAYPLISAFTGREPVAQVRERLRNERQADLSEEVLLVLFQHRILIEAMPGA